MRKIVSFLLIAGSIAWAGDMKSGSVILSKDGIKGIDSYTRFKRLTIKRIFPKLRVKNGTKSREGDSYKVIFVKRYNKTLFEIEARKRDRLKIGDITIVSGDIDNRFDFNIGDKYKKVFDGKEPKCVMGVEEMSGMAICEDDSFENFRFVFEGKNDGPDGKLPMKSELRRFELSKIIWSVK